MKPNNKTGRVESEFVIRKLSVRHLNDFRQLLLLFKEEFKMKDFKTTSENHLLKLFQSKYFIAFVAREKKVIIGGLTAYVLSSYYSDSSEVYIYDLAIKKNFQRKGMGKELLQSLKDYCSKNDYKIFFVQADETDAHALKFYRSTGGIPQKVIQFTYLTR